MNALSLSMLQTVALLLLLFSSGMGWVSGPTIEPLQPTQLQRTMEVDRDECPTCLKFAGEVLKVLLDVVTSGQIVLWSLSDILSPEPDGC